VTKESRSLDIVFENDFCVILNKPPGLATQGGQGVSVSLDSILSEKYSPRPLLVHRLDRDTSGLILVAKTKEAAAGFSVLLGGERNTEKGKKGRVVIKRYLGVCSGVPSPPRGVIRLKLEALGERRAKIRHTGAKQTETLQESETSYKLVSTTVAGEISCSLLELELGTGRMHQIRRHLARVSHPLLGDDKYGDFSLNKRLRKSHGLKRLLLHASRLVIPPAPRLMPEGLDISAPLPDYFSPFVSG